MWLSIAMVLVQFIVVVMRYAFGIGSILMQEAIVYMHAVLFMMAAADTLLAEAHVRVDIFMRVLRPQSHGGSVGNALLVLPFCVLLFLYRLTMCDCPGRCWRLARNQRHSAVFLLKSVILVFAVQLALQPCRA